MQNKDLRSVKLLQRMGNLCTCWSSHAAPRNHQFDYDLVVIGGGSAGIACVREAARLGATVALCEYALPSPKGSTWGLGGTCTNVGCFPKRLMHQSNLVKDCLDEAHLFGWKSGDNSEVNWEVLVSGIQDCISSLNFGYKVSLQQQKVTVYKGVAQFEDEHHLDVTLLDGSSAKISSQTIVIAVGGRPKYLGIPGGGAEDNLCITSDDIFTLPHRPGKTLCVGAGYIGVECAGFLAGFGFEVTLMARSVILREFDVTSVDLLMSNLEGRAVRIIRNAEPTKIVLVKNGSPPTLKVVYKFKGTNDEQEEEFNTILLAVGRKPVTNYLNLGVLPKIKLDPEGYIETDKYERTGVPNIFAIGDCAMDRPKLTPPAIRGGTWLAKRLYEKGFSRTVDYKDVPTTIFTPIEYGTCGLSEKEAVEKYGSNRVEVYQKSAIPTEFVMNKRDGEAVYAKLVCVRSGKGEKIVGLHYLGPNAGEVTLGLSLAIRSHLCKDDIDNLIGIHPTCAEIFTGMTVSKRTLTAVVRAQGC